ncbi:hypothetical protein AZ66_05495 [Paenibacillus sp. E194]|uniref:YgjP-like metallopeptidase domain-containing protein n=1 Tax=Paenibacillus sp. E194 TaxID=1458845 RepID=UPI0005E24581|nr:YgjP-like metallopeptidase domain-containing protein [Paenibacillus sp. E194]KJB88761.1 hypothetical protein AZ66_05495 [Paenibacillus sp. E194]
MHVFQFGSVIIPYELTRSSRRKTVSISVNQEGVKVIAPETAEHQVIEEVLYRKGAWIRTQLLNFEEMKQTSLQRRFVSGEKLPYLGRQYRLKIIKKADVDAPMLSFYQGQFLAEIHNDVAECQHRELIWPLYIDWVKHRGLILAKDE